ncbi:RidA family protein [Deinococcus cellulosilyticus]|uniref:Enamine deaminase RidA n=1 Tax=Deinococcus cellulosilyticus (strain DSM 18568 / NBRC 106333 / KACC 11606 / 5516J-15) TaxID=1223518 RepID=A0A511N949_DEIC1|nr:RidA family protein [Deinococcus cellulosilyticus]GEM49057.1 enamine deaminase RidA [Deinococcus cellulosilyticus NBRC 106333 = KACC 11606]
MSETRIERLNPSALHPVQQYSHVVQVTGGRTVYISGQIALDADGNLVGAGDFELQARQVMLNLQAALAAVQMDFRHVVKMTLFLKDRADIVRFRSVRAEFIQEDHLPAMSAVQVASLVREDLLLEMEAIAVG